MPYPDAASERAMTVKSSVLNAPGREASWLPASARPPEAGPGEFGAGEGTWSQRTTGSGDDWEFRGDRASVDARTVNSQPRSRIEAGALAWKQVAHSHTQCFRQPEQVQGGAVPNTALDTAHIAPADRRQVGQGLL